MKKSTRHEALEEKLKGLPAKPGCYVFRDASKEVLYVGKAISLRNRVRSYFQSSTRHGLRIARMVARVADLETIVVDSELEALVLECNLIKEHRPPFNIRLRDDKSYPYITITNERFPRVMFIRRPRKGGGKFFGPYTSAWAVRDTLRVLHKAFPLIPCGKSWSGKPEQRPCLYFHLGQCLAPCAGLADRNQYGEVLNQVTRILNGKHDSLIDELRDEMMRAADALEFERAAVLRERLGALEQIQQRQKVIAQDQVDRDIIAVVRDERGAAIQMLYVRGGKLIGQHQFLLDGSQESAPSEAVQEFVKQYYTNSPDVPREILLPVEIEEKAIVQQWLRSRRGKLVTVEVPRGGEKLRLVEMAAANAEDALVSMRNQLQVAEDWFETASEQLQEAFDLPSPPVRVEGFDISNIQGKAPVGSMVVSVKGEPAKDEYRRFKIRYHPESPDDYAMMNEVVYRRLKSFIENDDKFSKLADLMLIDGGKGQLMSALAARDSLELSVPMIGLAKRHELAFLPELVGKLNRPPREAARFIAQPIYEYRFREVELPLASPGLVLLQKLRDEAHRFAISYHRKIRDKRMSGSVIEEIPGIGPRRKRLLLRTFGSIAGIRKASVNEVASVPTMTKRLAEVVLEYLRES